MSLRDKIVNRLNENKFTVKKFDYKLNKHVDHGKFDTIEDASSAAKTLLGKNHGNQVKILDSQGKRIKKSK